MQQRSRFDAALAALLYVCVTLVLFYNLLPDLATHLYSDLGDPLLNTATIAWNARVPPLTAAWWNFPAFAPLSGVTAFTEHLLVTYPVASPIVWLTDNPALSYNVVFLLAFPLNGMATYALARALTVSSPGAFIGGLAFAFAPYQAAQLSHLQMLIAAGMPVALLGLYRYVIEGRRTGLLVFACGWAITALSNAYVLVLFPVLMVLWCAWFVRQPRKVLPIAIITIGVVVLMLPLLTGYRLRQVAYGLTRQYGEIKGLSADMTGLWAITGRELLWRGWLPQMYDEVALFPGMTTMALAIAGVSVHLRQTRGSAEPWPKMLFAAGAVIVLAGITGLSGLSVRPYRVITFGVLVAIAAVVLSHRLRHSWWSRDAAVFYAGAAVAMWLMALGPEPTWSGIRALTYGPYRLLLDLPGSQSIRVPARGWLPGALCLAVAAAFGAAALIARWPRYQRWIVPALATLILAEGWFHEGTARVPPARHHPQIPRGALVLDLPVGDAFQNSAAEYHAVIEGYRVLNGYSGYDPPHYEALRNAIRDQRSDMLDTYRRLDDLYVILPSGAAELKWIEGERGAVRESANEGEVIYRLPRISGRGSLPLPLPLPRPGTDAFVIPDRRRVP